MRGIRASRKGLRELRQGMFVIKFALHVSTVVCRTFRRCCGTCGEHLGWVHESVLVCARLSRATAWVDLRRSACALRHSCYLHFRPSPTLHGRLRAPSTLTRCYYDPGMRLFWCYRRHTTISTMTTRLRLRKTLSTRRIGCRIRIDSTQRTSTATA